MKLYTVTGFRAVFGAGAVLALAAEQARPRSGALREKAKGIYEVIGRVEFKCGETIGVEGAVDKRALAEMAPPPAAPHSARHPRKPAPPRPAGAVAGDVVTGAATGAAIVAAAVVGPPGAVPAAAADDLPPV